MNKLRTYSELIRIPTYEERFEFLRTNSKVSDITFGSKRYLIEEFYRSKEWLSIRDYVITRDQAYDLAFHSDIYLLNSRIEIHHINPVTDYDVIHHTDLLVDPEFLITTYHLTHKAIHYGNLDTLRAVRFANRSQNDTCPWRK